MAVVYDEIDLKIAELLEEGPHTTRQIADAIGEERDLVYRRCRKLARGDYVESEIVESDSRVYFFPTTGDVLTEANYESVSATIARLKEVARSVGANSGAQLTPTQKTALLSRYRTEFARLMKAASERERRQIADFERQLMAVMTGTTLADVLALIGLRWFSRKDAYWHWTGPPSNLLLKPA